MRIYVYRDPGLLEGVKKELLNYSEHEGYRFAAFSEITEITEDQVNFPEIAPEEADFYFFPVGSGLLDPDFARENGKVPKTAYLAIEQAWEKLLLRVPYFSRAPERHIFFQTGDWKENIASLSASILFKESAMRSSRSHALPYFIYPDNLTGHPLPPITDSPIDISFRGAHRGNPLRKALWPAIKHLLKTPFRTFFEYTDLVVETPQAYRLTYLKSILESKFVLCPRGFGLNSIRLFETLMMGRIPVIISDEGKLPLAEHIDYRKFAVQVPECKIDQISHYLEDFLRRNSLNEASQLARELAIEYFNADSMSRLVLKILRANPFGNPEITLNK